MDKIVKYYMAPLESVTTWIYRQAHAKIYGRLDKYFIPFLEPHEKRDFKTRELQEILPEHNEGIYVVPQILTNKADGFIRLGKALKDYGYQEINLNLGCPSKTVVTKGKGSGFLAFPEELDRFLDENQKRIKESSEQQQAEPCVHLVGNISPDELEETFSQFRNSHAHAEIVIYDSEQISFPVNKSNWAQ